jgi:hypothetical protein
MRGLWRIRLDRSSSELIDALTALIEAIDAADPALLEDSIAVAQKRLVRALQDGQPLGFEGYDATE